MGKIVKFLADKLIIRTRASDNALVITFEAGEYEKDNIAELLKAMDDVVYKVTVEVNGEETKEE